MADTVAFLGLGLIGGGLAEAALRRGWRTAVWNRTAVKARALAALGAHVAHDPADAVRGAGRVHLALSDDAAVESVLDAMHPGLGARAVIVDHSTTAPRPTAARMARLAADGVAYLHCPVFMSPAAARESSGLMLCAGARTVYDRVRADLERMTGRLWYVGEQGDRAAAHKLFGNAALVSLVAGLADVFEMARSLDIALPEAHELFSHFNPAAVLEYRGRKMAAEDYAPSFTLAMARKDVRLMIEAAGDRPLTVLPAIARRMDEAIEAGDGALDLGAISRSRPPRG